MSLKKISSFLVSACLILLVVSMVACSTPPQDDTPENNTIEIGVLIALTGWFSSMDMMELEETQVAVDLINEQGGITIGSQKYQVVLVPEDIKSSLDGCTAAANKLAYDKGLKFVTGPAAFFSTASSPILEAAEVLHVSAYNLLLPGEIGPDVPYGFIAHNSVAGGSIAMAKAFKSEFPEAKTACVVMPDDGAIPFAKPVAKNALEEVGITMVGDVVGFPMEMVDFSPIAVAVNALDTDITFAVSGTSYHACNTAKALRESGNLKPYGGAVGASVSDIASIAGAELTTDILSNAMLATNPHNPPQMQEIIDTLREQRGEERSVFFHQANAAWVLMKAIEAAQSLDPTVVKETLESMGTIDTILGEGTICGSETFGINHAVAHPQQYQLIVNTEEVKGGCIYDVYIP